MLTRGKSFRIATFPSDVASNHSCFLQNKKIPKLFECFVTSCSFHLVKFQPTLSCVFGENIQLDAPFQSSLLYNIPTNNGPIAVCLDSYKAESPFYLNFQCESSIKIVLEKFWKSRDFKLPHHSPIIAL